MGIVNTRLPVAFTRRAVPLSGATSSGGFHQTSERAMEVRILASAANSANAWDLRCDIREKMIAWLNEAYPHALPRDRIDLTGVDVDTASAARSGPREQRVQ